MIQDIFPDANGELMKDTQKKNVRAKGHKENLYTTRPGKIISSYQFEC